MILILDSETSSPRSDSLWITKRNIVTSSSNSLSTLECHSTGPGEMLILSKSSLTVFSQNLGSPNPLCHGLYPSFRWFSLMDKYQFLSVLHSLWLDLG